MQATPVEIVQLALLQKFDHPDEIYHAPSNSEK